MLLLRLEIVCTDRGIEEASLCMRGPSPAGVADPPPVTWLSLGPPEAGPGL